MLVFNVVLGQNQKFKFLNKSSVSVSFNPLLLMKLQVDAVMMQLLFFVMLVVSVVAREDMKWCCSFVCVAIFGDVSANGVVGVDSVGFGECCGVVGIDGVGGRG